MKKIDKKYLWLLITILLVLVFLFYFDVLDLSVTTTPSFTHSTGYPPPPGGI